MLDPVVTSSQLPPLTEQHWQAINPAYGSVLRLVIALYVMTLCATAVAYCRLTGAFALPVAIAAVTLLLLLGFALMLLWVPRRVKHTEYLLRQHDISVRVGVWWHSTTTAALNRVQHTEVVQGPLERLYGLSKLLVYTAGGAQSDIKIPGLTTATAHQLKNYVIAQTAAEELPNDPE